MFLSAKRDKPLHPSLILNNSVIEDVTVHEHLGLTLSSNLSWRAHFLKINLKASKKLNLLKPLKYDFSRYTLEVLFKSLVRSSSYANKAHFHIKYFTLGLILKVIVFQLGNGLVTSWNALVNFTQS